VFKVIKDNYPNDWLLSVELYELAKNNNDTDFAESILSHLEQVKRNKPKVGHLIDDGISLVNEATINIQ
jgi:phenylalanine-4-hydroxylase